MHMITQVSDVSATVANQYIVQVSKSLLQIRPPKSAYLVVQNKLPSYMYTVIILQRKTALFPTLSPK